MGMGRQNRRQESLWIVTQKLPRTKGQVFYERANRILEEIRRNGSHLRFQILDGKFSASGNFPTKTGLPSANCTHDSSKRTQKSRPWRSPIPGPCLRGWNRSPGSSRATKGSDNRSVYWASSSWTSAGSHVPPLQRSFSLQTNSSSSQFGCSTMSSCSDHGRVKYAGSSMTTS